MHHLKMNSHYAGFNQTLINMLETLNSDNKGTLEGLCSHISPCI